MAAALPWPDARVALATQHGKADALGPPLAAVGLEVVAVVVDTDALGTFSGEVERIASPRDTVIAKARLGMAASGLRLGLASEASFGPDPLLGFVPLHRELLAFIDDVHGQVLVLEQSSRDTNWQGASARRVDDVQALLQSSGFPEHALLVRPNRFVAGMPVAKGLRDRSGLAQAIAAMAALSDDGLARVESDMRAHMNPTRQRQLRALGLRLAERLAVPCPACGAPGFGHARSEAGLPCADCAAPTDMLLAEVHACGCCGHEERRPRPDGRVEADPGACAFCNP